MINHPNFKLAAAAEEEWFQLSNPDCSTSYLSRYSQWLTETYGAEFLMYEPYLKIHDPEKFLILVIKHS